MAPTFDDELVTRVARAADEWSPGATLQSWAAVTKGSSSQTYAVELVDGTARHVPAYVKVAPPGLAPVRNRDVLRQAALMAELYRHRSVPVPRVLFDDRGSPPETPPFFVAEAVPGTCLEPLVDDAALPDPAVLLARSSDAARTLARLHGFGPAALRGRGLTDAGEQTDLSGEVDRWARVFATLDAGGNGAELGLNRQAEQCAERLRRSAPPPLAPVVVHGDFRLGNLVCDDGGVRAILDWEIWSLTDPRIDVAWFLMTLSPQGLPSAVRTHAPGLLEPDQALAIYEDASGTDLTDLNWFAGLSRFRAAAAMALNVKHNRRRAQPNPRIEAYAARLPSFLSLAIEMLP